MANKNVNSAHAKTSRGEYVDQLVSDRDIFVHTDLFFIPSPPFAVNCPLQS